MSFSCTPDLAGGGGVGVPHIYGYSRDTIDAQSASSSTTPDEDASDIQKTISGRRYPAMA
jgi:hypothetical protein